MMRLPVHNRAQQTVKLNDGSVAYVSGTTVLVHYLAEQGYPMWRRLSLSTEETLDVTDREALTVIHRACNLPIAL